MRAHHLRIRFVFKTLKRVSRINLEYLRSEGKKMGIYRQFGRPDIDALTTSASHRALSSDALVFIQSERKLSLSHTRAHSLFFSLSLFCVWNRPREPLEKYSRPREVFISIVRARRDRLIRSFPIKIRAIEARCHFIRSWLIRYI